MSAASNAINIPGTSTSYSDQEATSSDSSGLARMLANSPTDHGFRIDGAGSAPGLGFADKQSWFTRVARDLAAKEQMGVIHTQRPQTGQTPQAEDFASPPSFFTYAYRLFAAHREAQGGLSMPVPQNDYLVAMFAQLKGEPESAPLLRNRGPQSKALPLSHHALFEEQTGNY